MFHQEDYGPEILAVMGTALDRVCQRLPELDNGNEEVREWCASMIIRFIDSGEQDAIRLYELTVGQ